MILGEGSSQYCRASSSNDGTRNHQAPFPLKSISTNKTHLLPAKTGPPAKPTASEVAPGSTKSTKPTTHRPRTHWQPIGISVSQFLRSPNPCQPKFLTISTAWLSTEITYGLYLSDHSILDAVDTELVVLGGIMMQNLPRETGWHLRGTRRIGVSFEDVETVQQCVSLSRVLFLHTHSSSLGGF